MLVRLATGCSWEDAERLCGNKVSDTTVRSRRDECAGAGVFEAIVNEAVLAYNKVIALPVRTSRSMAACTKPQLAVCWYATAGHDSDDVEAVRAITILRLAWEDVAA